jgi:hypothetical protein
MKPRRKPKPNDLPGVNDPPEIQQPPYQAGWSCPSCGGAHPPWVTACPCPRVAYYFPPATHPQPHEPMPMEVRS